MGAFLGTGQTCGLLILQHIQLGTRLGPALESRPLLASSSSRPAISAKADREGGTVPKRVCGTHCHQMW